MFARRRLARWSALGGGLVAAGVLASAVIASQMDDGSALIEAIDEAPLTHVADVEAADGAPTLGVYLQATTSGHVCVWEAKSPTSRDRGGGCNTADDPLNGRALSVTLSYDGGPAVADVQSASLFGLAAPDVARAQVLMSDGSTREIALRRARVGAEDFKAFGHRVKKRDLRKGIAPVAVLALDASGSELGRQPTGFGG